VRAGGRCTPQLVLLKLHSYAPVAFSRRRAELQRLQQERAAEAAVLKAKGDSQAAEASTFKQQLQQAATQVGRAAAFAKAEPRKARVHGQSLERDAERL